jgi:uncharacterized membrane protein
MSDLDNRGTGADPPPPTNPVRSERRIVPSLAVVASMVIPLLLPAPMKPAYIWLLPAVEGIFLVAVVAMDPGRIDHLGRQVRAVSIALVVAIAASAAWGTLALVLALVDGKPQTSQARELLVAGALVWLDGVIAFSFVYWELDSGGPAVRLTTAVRYPDLAFPQQMNPDLAPPGWRPVFVDYLYLGLTNGLAFSPTDVMPLATWAKLTMALQSLISVVILSLVIANSVNLLG